ncbi:MAG: hypothetical protein IPJ30_16630 [Acidobacteria bacterium]|nr:hypothetical protein [Acidobacteriota bacterium]
MLDQNNHPIGRYFYDGEGRRVKKVTDLETTVFVYDASSKLIAEYSNQTPQNPNTSYVATDTLLSVRLVTDRSGNVVSRRDFKPFGEDLAADQTFRKTTDKYSTATQDKVRQRFTGYQKDIETGLDFAEARMYENRHGRFTAVDPLLASGKSANPQTFNRFVYVMNAPLFFVDKNGKWPTEIHKQIIQIAFKNLSESEVEKVIRGSNLIDTLFGTGGYFDFPITLFVSEAYKHAMIPEGMSYEEAYRMAQGFADSQRKEAVRLQGDSADLSLQALEEFGKGRHVFTDAISPAHGPFEVYSIPKIKIQTIDKSLRADHSFQLMENCRNVGPLSVYHGKRSRSSIGRSSPKRCLSTRSEKEPLPPNNLWRP